MTPLSLLFVVVIQRNSQLVILSLGSSFFWLLSILLSSLVWLINIHYLTIPITVVFQELGRFAFWWIYSRTFKEGSFKDDSTRPPEFMAALSIGWGFATTSTLLTYIANLSHFTGPAFLPAPMCSTVSVFYVLALSEVLFSIMHVCWNLLAFEGFNSKVYWMPIFVVFFHLFSSIMTKTLNDNPTGGCIVGSLSTTIAIALVVVGVTLWYFVTKSNGMVKYIR